MEMVSNQGAAAVHVAVDNVDGHGADEHAVCGPSAAAPDALSAR